MNFVIEYLRKNEKNSKTVLAPMESFKQKIRGRKSRDTVPLISQKLNVLKLYLKYFLKYYSMSNKHYCKNGLSDSYRICSGQSKRLCELCNDPPKCDSFETSIEKSACLIIKIHIFVTLITHNEQIHYK